MVDRVIFKGSGGSGRAHPMVVDFQNAPPEEGCECRTMFDGIRQTAVIFGRGGVYAGAEADGPARNLIVARNRRTGRVRVVEVGLAAAKAVLREEGAASARPEDRERDRLENRDKFGSKRLKRAAEVYAKLKVDVDASGGRLLETAMGVIIDAADVAPKLSAESDATAYAPPADRNATEPGAVYDLRKIAGPDLLAELRLVAETVLDGDASQVPMSDYAVAASKKIRASDGPERLDRCSALVYADALIKYATDPGRKVRTKQYRACEYSDIIGDAIMDEFSAQTDNGKTKSQAMNDKAVCHVIVLLLIANGCMIPGLEDLCKALHMRQQKLVQMVRVVGARLVSGPDHTGIILKLPLAPPPTVSVKREKKSK